MEPKFTLNRPKISDDEIEAKKDFDALVKKFKEKSIQDARKRKLNPKLRKLVYTTVIAGFLVVCTVSINELTHNKSNEKTATSLSNTKPILKDTQQKKFIQPITKDAKLAYSKYTVNANKGGVITHSSKSQITVPKAAFVKKDGKEVTGSVEIHYREMHDVADQLVSGIPMMYDSAGSKFHFESAGMVDIKGFHNGEEVFIRPGKNLDINMVSRKDGSRFNVYYLDTIAKKWNFIGKDKIIGIDEVAESKTEHHTPQKMELTSVEKQIQQSIEGLQQKKEELIVTTDKKIAALPTPAEPQKPVAANKQRKQFTLDVNYDKFPELKSFKGCVFEVGEENTQYTKEFSEITWSDAYITSGTQKGKNYTLNLEKGYRKEKLIVYPVLAGKKLEEAQAFYEKKFAEYEMAFADRKEKEKQYREDLEKDLEKIKKEEELWIAKMEAERKKRANEAVTSLLSAEKSKDDVGFKVRRVFQINNFGVFNTDCAQKLPNTTIANAVFLSDKGILQPSVAYLIDKDKNMMYTYSSADLENFRYNNNGNYQIVATVNNEVFVCDYKAFNQAEKQGDKTVFAFTSLDLNAMDADELRKKLGV